MEGEEAERKFHSWGAALAVPCVRISRAWCRRKGRASDLEKVDAGTQSTVGSPAWGSCDQVLVMGQESFGSSSVLLPRLQRG